jgi:hypothetical protein
VVFVPAAVSNFAVAGQTALTVRGYIMNAALHATRTRNFALSIVAAATLVLALAACGGGSDSAASSDVETETVAVEETGTTTESDASDDPETNADTGSSDTAVPAAAPGTGTLELDDGRAFAITVTECEFQPSGTFEIKGTSDQGSEFDMTQFYLSDEWSQTDASIEFPNRDQIYVIVSSSTPDAEPATVDGKSVTWVQTFRELDESANAHVYTGKGTLSLTCS